MVSNIAQEWIEEGKALGLLRGVEQGMAKGIAKGEARILTRQLAHRFGSLPVEVTVRIQEADTDALETWADRLLDARTLDEVFAPEKASLS